MQRNLMPKITVNENPAPADREAIFGPLLKYNDSKVAPPTIGPLAVFVRGPATDAIVGGLWAQSVYDWLFVELLFLPEVMRGKGIGTALMREAETVAMKRGCVGVWLDTYSFQARAFYEKLGYEVFGVLEDFPRGQSRYFFRKILTRA